MSPPCWCQTQRLLGGPNSQCSMLCWAESPARPRQEAHVPPWPLDKGRLGEKSGPSQHPVSPPPPTICFACQLAGLRLRGRHHRVLPCRDTDPELAQPGLAHREDCASLIRSRPRGRPCQPARCQRLGLGSGVWKVSLAWGSMKESLGLF